MCLGAVQNDPQKSEYKTAENVQDNQAVESGNNIVKHDAEAAVETPVKKVDRKRLGNVKNAEKIKLDNCTNVELD